MRQTFLAAAAAFVIGGAATGAVLSQAQPAAPSGGASSGMTTVDEAPQHGWMMRWRHGPVRDGARPIKPRDFALVYRQPDRRLAPADVQKIAEAFLLWNGNHTWKVTDVAAAADGPIGFSLTTPEGSVVARFAMDPHSGQITRVS